MPGKLIAIEGPDGVGKSTLIELLASAIGENVQIVREPGGTQLSERIRKLIKGELYKGAEIQINPRAEALLFCAARSQLTEEVLRPLLAEDKTVLLDRFELSTIIYQGIARKLGEEEVLSLSRFATDNLVPDVTLVLDLDEKISLERQGSRGPEDRMERETQDKRQEIRENYLRLARAEGHRIISAEGTPEEVLRRALEALAEVPD